MHSFPYSMASRLWGLLASGLFTDVFSSWAHGPLCQRAPSSSWTNLLLILVLWHCLFHKITDCQGTKTLESISYQWLVSNWSVLPSASSHPYSSPPWRPDSNPPASSVWGSRKKAWPLEQEIQELDSWVGCFPRSCASYLASLSLSFFIGKMGMLQGLNKTQWSWTKHSSSVVEAKNIRVTLSCSLSHFILEKDQEEKLSVVWCGQFSPLSLFFKYRKFLKSRNS